MHNRMHFRCTFGAFCTENAPPSPCHPMSQCLCLNYSFEKISIKTTEMHHSLQRHPRTIGHGEFEFIVLMSFIWQYSSGNTHHQLVWPNPVVPFCSSRMSQRTMGEFMADLQAATDVMANGDADLGEVVRKRPSFDDVSDVLEEIDD